MTDNNDKRTNNQLSDEEFFKSIAELYSEEEGRELLREANVLNAAGRPTKRLDRLVKKHTGEGRSYGWRSIAAMAACAALVFVIYNRQSLLPNTSQSNAPAAAPVASAAPSDPAPAPSAAPAAPSAEAPSDSLQPVNTEKPVITEASFVSAKLPPGYSLNAMEFDHGETIFYLENINKNDIVLTIAKADGIFESGMYQSVNINDTKAYAVLTGDYGLLEFEHEGLKYRLTSPYDYGDLIEISKKLI